LRHLLVNLVQYLHWEAALVEATTALHHLAAVPVAVV